METLNNVAGEWYCCGSANWVHQRSQGYWLGESVVVCLQQMMAGMMMGRHWGKGIYPCHLSDPGRYLKRRDVHDHFIH